MIDEVDDIAQILSRTISAAGSEQHADLLSLAMQKVRTISARMGVLETEVVRLKTRCESMAEHIVRAEMERDAALVAISAHWVCQACGGTEHDGCECSKCGERVVGSNETSHRRG